MTEQCKGERGPEPGERRWFTCAKDVSIERIAAWESDGWRFLRARSSAMDGHGLPRMVDVEMEYAP